MTAATPWIVAALIAGAYLLLRPLRGPDGDTASPTWPAGGGGGGTESERGTDPDYPIPTPDHSDDLLGEVLEDDPPVHIPVHDPRHPDYDATRASDFGETVPDTPGVPFRVRGHPYCKTGEPQVAPGIWPVVHGYDCDPTKPRRFFDVELNQVHAQWPPSHLADLRRQAYEAQYGKPYPEEG